MKTLLIYLLFLVLPLSTWAQVPGNEIDQDLEPYYLAGVPSLDRIWTPSDFTTAINACFEAHEKDKLALPNRGDNSILLLEFITDPENWFVAVGGHDLPIDQKYTYLAPLQEGIQKLALHYTLFQEFDEGQLVYSYESVLCMQAMFHVLDDFRELADFVIETTPELNQAQKNGLDQMKTGIATSFAGCLITLEQEYESYRAEDICLLSRHFFPCFSRSKDFIFNSAKIEFDQRVTAISKSHELPCVREWAVQE